MSLTTCGRCPSGWYLCPSDLVTCVPDSASYTKCPGLAGTHLDASLDVDKRLAYLISKVSLEDQIAQLRNTAPEIAHMGIPSYQWLNDDQHGVARAPQRATVFPNGCALGATFSKRTLKDVGRVIGTEARGLHNFNLAVDPGGRNQHCNGCGITLYAPNLNLVRDPRCVLGPVKVR
jgi:beta-glucosidase